MESNVQKTIADIIAEKRELAERLRLGTPTPYEIEAALNLEYDANRIEAAWKREELRWAKANGELVFKWGQRDISVERVLEVIGREPLYGHITGKGHNTLWAVYVKLEGGEG